MKPRDVTLALLTSRAPGKTVCPSEVAKTVVANTDPGNWRSAMPAVHAAIDGLLDIGLVRLSWKGKALKTRSGPYRIGRGASWVS